MKKIITFAVMLSATIATQAQRIEFDSTGDFANIGVKTKKDTPAINTGKLFINKRNWASPIFLSRKGRYFYFGVTRAGRIFKKYIVEGKL